jgi:hypothetical protein
MVRKPIDFEDQDYVAMHQKHRAVARRSGLEKLRRVADVNAIAEGEIAL